MNKAIWKNFLNILLHPIVLLTMLLSVSGTFLSTLFYKEDTKSIAVLLSILASLSAGVFGSVVFEQYKEATGNNILIKKGKSAVRNLSLIADQLHRLRIRLFELSTIKAKTPFTEIDHHIVTTEKSIISGIEDWVDMVPELDTIAKISEFVVEKGNKIRSILSEKKELEKELTQLDETQKEKVSSLEARIKSKDDEISKLYSQISKLRGQQVSIAGPTISSGVGVGTALLDTNYVNYGGSILTMNNLRKCMKCGNNYSPPLCQVPHLSDSLSQ